MWLLGLFAALALGLSGVGIYGVTAYGVSQLTREIGIRVALGAGHGHVFGLVARQSLLAVACGMAVGIPAAWALARALSSLLFDISPADGTTFALVPVVVAAVAGLATWLPARRALRVDPNVALRYD
jgi:ABC-type antimicrobial peptide transport system permease subunit